MIQVIVKKQNGNITGFHMEGHAGYADRGSDIVCASISVLAINCVNSIEEFTEDSFSEGMDEERGMISFDLTGEISEKTQLLLQSMLLESNILPKNMERSMFKLLIVRRKRPC